MNFKTNQFTNDIFANKPTFAYNKLYLFYEKS